MQEDETVKVTEDGTRRVYRKSTITATDGSPTHVMTNDNEDLKTKAMRAESAVTDLVDSAIDRGVSSLKSKANELLRSGTLEPGSVQANKDAANIGSLGNRVTALARTFEEVISNIREQPYDEQVKLLAGYKKLLEEQINVINSRIQFAKRIH